MNQGVILCIQNGIKLRLLTSICKIKKFFGMTPWTPLKGGGIGQGKGGEEREVKERGGKARGGVTMFPTKSGRKLTPMAASPRFIVVSLLCSFYPRDA